MTEIEITAAPDHGTEHRPAEVQTASGRTFSAIDHGMALAGERSTADYNGFKGNIDYAVRVSHRSTEVVHIDKITPAGARELARQLIASADEVEARLQADQDAAATEVFGSLAGRITQATL